jgi:hypothetical protein
VAGDLFHQWPHFFNMGRRIPHGPITRPVLTKGDGYGLTTTSDAIVAQSSRA